MRHRLFKINSQQCAWKDLSKGLENGGGWNWYLSGETAVVIIPEGSKMDVKFGISHGSFGLKVSFFGIHI